MYTARATKYKAATRRSDRVVRGPEAISRRTSARARQVVTRCDSLRGAVEGRQASDDRSSTPGAICVRPAGHRADRDFDLVGAQLVFVSSAKTSSTKVAPDSPIDGLPTRRGSVVLSARALVPPRGGMAGAPAPRDTNRRITPMDELQAARERTQPLLNDLAPDAELVRLVFSLLVADDDDQWLMQRLADALRD